MPGWVRPILRLFPSVRALESECGRLAAEAARLSAELAQAERQREELGLERDDLKAHLRRVSLEAEEAWRHHGQAVSEREAASANSAALQVELKELDQTLRAVVDERDRLRVECVQQHEARGFAERQRDALEAERDGLKAALAPLLSQRDALQAEAAAQHAARREAQDQRDLLAAERDELRVHASRLDRELAETRHALRRTADHARMLESRTWVEPGHFYSPIVNPSDPVVLRRLEEIRRFAPADPLRIPVNDGTQLESVRMVARHAPDCPFPEKPTAGFRYYFANAAFNAGDAITLYAMLREFQPRRIVEVGCGYSSAAMLDVMPEAETVHIDPYPAALLALLEPGDPARARILQQCVQDVPDEVFQRLRAGDLLFIDSSHVVKTASDVHDLLFRVLPLLASGTLVHVHDIFYPFEYPPEWLLGENRSWNEAYLLRALLTGNPGYHILLWNDYAYQRFPDETPERLRSERGGSIWITKS